MIIHAEQCFLIDKKLTSDIYKKSICEKAGQNIHTLSRISTWKRLKDSSF